MKCIDCVERIARMLAGSLEDGELRELNIHLARCPTCRAEVALQREITAALREEPTPSLSADFTARVGRAALAAARETGPFRAWPALAPAFVSIVGAIIMHILTGGPARMLASLHHPSAALARLFVGLADVVGRGPAASVPSPPAWLPHLDLTASSFYGIVLLVVVAALATAWAVKRLRAVLAQ